MKINDYTYGICNKRMPLGMKKLKKLGTLKRDFVESTPFVYNGDLMLFEWVRPHSWAHNKRARGYYHIVNLNTAEESAPFGYDHAFGACYEEDGNVYVAGVRGNDGWSNKVDVIYSSDLVNWNTKLAVTLPEGISAFNTSICKGDGEYIMAIEIGTREGRHPLVGVNFTIVFAKSKDLLSWELLPLDTHIYAKERYTACPSIRYFDGYYYMAYLEEAPYQRYITYLVRSRDLEYFEVADINPILTPDDDDKKLIDPQSFSSEDREYIEGAFNCNASDIDFCDYNGKAVIVYSWGNQHGKEFLAMAEYDGTLKEFLESHFLE